jgi:hypothetical protein
MSRWHYTNIARTKLSSSVIHSHSDASGNYILSMWSLTLLILTIGLRHFSQLRPGSRVVLPIVTSLKFASSTLPLSNGCVSSGELRLLFCILAILSFSSSPYFYFKHLVLAQGNIWPLMSLPYFDPERERQ